MSLSDTEIKSELNRQIIIEPFKQENLGPNSYDVTLGEFYYTHNETDNLSYYLPTKGRKRKAKPISRKSKFISTQNGSQIAEYWHANTDSPNYGSKRATKIEDQKTADLLGVELNSSIIILSPGQLILGHTNEIVGTIDNYNTVIQSRSTAGRIGLTICKDASCGNIGFVNRWTLEIENHAEVPIVLVVGQKIAQILFYRTGSVTNSYAKTGQYNCTNWTPLNMIPSVASYYLKNN